MNPDERCKRPHWYPPRSCHYRLLLSPVSYADQISAVKNDGSYIYHPASVRPVQARLQMYRSTSCLFDPYKERIHYYLLMKLDLKCHCGTILLLFSIRFHGFLPTSYPYYLLRSHKYWNGNIDWSF